MQVEISTQAWKDIDADWLVVGVCEPPDLTGPLAELDAALSGRIARLRELEDLSGKHAETRELRGVEGLAAKRVLLVGLGKSKDLNLPRIEKALLTAARKISDKKVSRAAVVVPVSDAGFFTAAEAARTTVAAFHVGC